MLFFRQTSKIRWCDDTNKIGIPRAYFYDKNLKEVVKGTKWQYSCLKEYVENVHYLYIDKFLNEYIKIPSLEYFIKFGLYEFVKNILESYTPSWKGYNFNAKSIKDVFGIDKPTFLQMQRLNLGKYELDLIKTSLSKGKILTDQEIRWIVLNGTNQRFITLLDYATPHKIIEYVKKQTTDKHSSNSVITDWSDYIEQCVKLKFDLNNSFVLFPKDLHEKHSELSIMGKVENLKKYDNKVMQVFDKMNETFYFSTKKLSITVASNVREIIREGHILRHCVGSLGYISKITKCESLILLVRRTKEPDVPYYTLELNLKGLYVEQCRGYSNEDMTKEVREFINTWKEKKLNNPDNNRLIQVSA